MRWHALIEGAQSSTALRGRLPVVSGMRLAKAVKKLGYIEVGQRGSHLKLRKILPDDSHHQIVIPMHEELHRGKLAGLLGEISRINGITKQRLVQML
jgi:predicted RNA binding protein YcfA (HicA-like mRNA interferase family)